MEDKYSTIQQHQPLRVPVGWDKQEKAFVLQLDEIFDDIYRRFGRLRLEDLSKTFRKQIEDDEGNIAELLVDVGQIVIDVGNKYDKISGITINSNGIDISGSKYLKLESGGTLDINSNNFVLDSANQKMKAGNWQFDPHGALYTDVANQQFEISNSYDQLAGKRGGLYFIKDTNGGIVRLYVSKLDNSAYAQLNLETSSSNIVYLYSTGTRYTILGKEQHPFADAYLQNIVGRNYTQNNATAGKSLVFVLNAYDPNDAASLMDGAFLWLESKYSDSDYSTYISTNGPARFNNKVYIPNLYYTNMYQTSSRDIKHDIREMESPGEKIDALKPVNFVYDDDPEEKTRAGLIYEDTVEVMPEICTGDEENKAINYAELVPVLLKEIQELRARVAALEGGQQNG